MPATIWRQSMAMVMSHVAMAYRGTAEEELRRAWGGVGVSSREVCVRGRKAGGGGGVAAECASRGGWDRSEAAKSALGDGVGGKRWSSHTEWGEHWAAGGRRA